MATEHDRFKPELVGKVVEIYGKIGGVVATLVGTLQAYGVQPEGVGFRLVGDVDSTIFDFKAGDEIYSVKGGF